MDNSLPSSSVSFTQHIINAVESDFMIECVNQYSKIIVDMANERSSEANGARLETWARITEMFNQKFSLDVTTKALKSNLSYRQGKLKRNPNKYNIYREWLSNPSKSERVMEKELGRGDFILLKLFGEDMEKPQNKRKLDESESTMRNEWSGNEHETSPYQVESMFMDIEPKEEFDPDVYEVSEDSRPPTETLAHTKRTRLPPPPSQLLPRAPTPIVVNRVDDESVLRIELLKAQIELTKTQQVAAEKQIQSNTSMIVMMERLTKRMESKKDESDHSSVSNLISIMKEIVKK